ncbi:MAG: hypothetical protein AB1603_01505 [Chloroflexota bacterium]
MDTQPALLKAIDQVVADFQVGLKKSWNERDLHWCLFYHLKDNGDIREEYPTQLIRAEFPTWEYREKARRTRGHYDLVVLDRESVVGDKVKELDFDAEWDEWLPSVTILAAVEMKLWLSDPLSERSREAIKWDIDKLTPSEGRESGAKVVSVYYLNFVQMDFNRSHAQRYLQDLERHLTEQKAEHPSLNILCVAGGPPIQRISTAHWL